MVLKAHETVDSRLGDGVAIRVVAHPEAISLLNKVGPLTATSANRSGVAPVEDCEKAARSLSSLGEEVSFVEGGVSGGFAQYIDSVVFGLWFNTVERYRGSQRRSSTIRRRSEHG